jgi:hypothetical protein
MIVVQCPRCELKFSSRSEMQSHLREDHPPATRTTSTPDTITIGKPSTPRPADQAPTPGRWRRIRTLLRRAPR